MCSNPGCTKTFLDSTKYKSAEEKKKKKKILEIMKNFFCFHAPDECIGLTKPSASIILMASL